MFAWDGFEEDVNSRLGQLSGQDMCIQIAA